VKLNLAAAIKRRSRKPIALPNIAPTQAQTDDLARIYLRVVAMWREGAAGIVAEYERTLGEMTTDSAGSTGSAIDGVQVQVNRLLLSLDPALRDWIVRVERVLTGKWVRGVLSATDVDLSTVLSPSDVSDTVEAVLEWNTSLIRDVSDELRRRVANSVFAGFQRRAPAREIAKEISNSVGLSRARSLRIAADQTVKLGARLNQARQEQAGLTSFKWRHSAKAHPRSWHLHRDGRIFSWADPGIPADDMPGVPPYCGCTAQGVVVFGHE
jgi:SPP1 gp7 family putative phage head morphogenesis protein